MALPALAGVYRRQVVYRLEEAAEVIRRPANVPVRVLPTLSVAVTEKV
jgi:hypothetical protein